MIRKQRAGEKKQARHYVWLLVVINYVLLGVICTAMFFCRGLVVGWYHLSAPSARLAEDLILAHTIAMIIWPLAFTFPYYFRASGSAAFIMVISIVSIWIFRVGLAHVFILVLHMSVLGIWYAMFIDWIFRILIFAIHYRRHYT